MNPIIQIIADAIARFEGFYSNASTLAQRNNNPGNLRAGVGQTGTDTRGYAMFATVEDGWNALYNQISLDMGRGLTLQQFISKYAPPSDNNPTSSYLAYVAGKTGLPVDVPMNELGSSPPADASASDPITGPATQTPDPTQEEEQES